MPTVSTVYMLKRRKKTLKNPIDYMENQPQTETFHLLPSYLNNTSYEK